MKIQIFMLMLWITLSWMTKGDDQPLPKLYWTANRAGLFSHFLQMKAMYHFATTLNRQLVVIPTKCPHHYGKLMIRLCDIFDLPPSISCGTPPHGMNCTDAIPSNISTKDVCYDGAVMGALKRAIEYYSNKEWGNIRSALMNENNSPSPSIVFNEHIRDLTEVLKIKLGIEPQKNLTVVHWRRGDQLTIRCGHGDRSVNCGSAQALEERIKPNTNDKLVYIATNEAQNTDEMKYLREEAGFKTFSSAVDGRFENLNLFEILGIEVTLMLEASTFLGWGVTEVNDVVESERCRNGKSCCLDQKGNSNSWCWKHFINPRQNR